MKLYENIKRLRTENGMTQEELAMKTGYTDRSSIARIEAGQIDLPHSKIIAFASVFNVDPVVLMGISDEQEERDEINGLIEQLNDDQRKAALAFLRTIVRADKQA